HLGPDTGYVHSAYQVADLDALAAGGAYLAERGYRRSWGIGRHIQGSQIFDYWRDPDRFLVEHFTDGDLFDNTLEPGWAAMSASGLAQWGPPATRDFLGATPSPALLRKVLTALREDNEIDPARLKALMK
ncbi:2,3-dihydroxybiphenyl 1,2-dioxygenase, partial [Streptomyces sp. SID8455]|nr:2,3-dihydroxybiphenyl 1,2-dioxygenase [Streptomyces sp. SID8455]